MTCFVKQKIGAGIPPRAKAAGSPARRVMKNIIRFLKNNIHILVLFSILLGQFACSPNEETPNIENKSDNAIVELPNRVARDLIVETTTDIGIPISHATFHVKKSEEYLTLEPKDISFPSAFISQMSVMLENLKGELFQYPVSIGQTWQEKGYRRVNSSVTLEKYEPIETPLGTFKKCLKHKTVLTNAKMRTQIEKALISGTRYLWFAKGVGIVKMRYEHSNGVVTIAELIDYKIEGESKDYLPTIPGTSWTYRWKNDYFNETYIEDIKVSDGRKNSTHSNVVCTLTTNVKTTDGKDKGKGSFYITKSDKHLTLRSSTIQSNDSTLDLYLNTGIPYSLRILLQNVSGGIPEKGLLLYPLTKGKTWKQTYQYLWKAQEDITIEGYESVQVADEEYSQTLKHKTIISEADTGAISTDEEQLLLNNVLINGTRYLWFAKGIGIVKMRYEHSNGTVTDAELIEYNVPKNNEEYFPLNLGTTWTYGWKNSNHEKPLIEKIQVVRAGGGNETPLKQANYTVTVDPEKQDIMHVSCELSPQEQNINKIRLALNTDGKYIDSVHLGQTTVYRSIPSDRYVWEFESEDSYKSPLTLRYEVYIDHDTNRNKMNPEKKRVRLINEKLPYEKEDCIFFPSNMLFIVGGECDNITVEFKLPKRWHVSTPWQRIGRRGHKYSVNNLKELTQPYLLIGNHAEVVAWSGKTEVLLAIGDSLKESRDELKGVVEECISVYSDLFNGEPTLPMLFILNPYNQELGNQMKGSGRGQSISILMDRTLADSRKHKWGPFLAHEVFHIWNGQTALNNFSKKEHWFKEGVSDYYADITAYRLGYLSKREYLNRLEYASEAYLSASTEQKITNSIDRKLLYNGGSLVTAALDFEIRELTDNRKSFDHVLKQMYIIYNNTSVKYTLTDIINVVNNVAGKNFEPFFNMYVDGKDKLPLTEYLGKAGLDVQTKYNEELPTYAYVTQVIKESLGKETPVKVSAINGLGIAKHKELRKIAKEWKSGDAIELTYIETEEDNYVTKPVTLDELPVNPPTTPEIVVQITENKQMTKLQRAIFTDILSKD